MSSLLEIAVNLSANKITQQIPDYKRFLFYDIKKSDSKIIGIYGARGVGKTTLMLQLLKDLNLPLRETIYISCDHPVFSGVSLFDFLEEFSKKGGKIAFVDEVHKAPEFQAHLKSTYDFLDIKVIFSGSSAVQMTNPDFTRRFSMYRLPALSLREFIELELNISLKNYLLEEIIKNHQDVALEIIRELNKEKILKLFGDYLEYGVYPFYLEDKKKFKDRLSDSINATLYTDLAEIYNIHPEKIVTLKKLLTTIAVSEPLELSVENIASVTGISKATLYKYIDYLSRAELIMYIQNEAKRFKSIRKPDKLYLANTNLLNALCLNAKKGTMRETFFASMLRYRHSLYYSNKVDFLINEKYLFEVGGKNKDFSQVKNNKNSYLAIDDIEMGFERKIPLWLFGFLY
ncbi:ATP-binding protein [Deferribacter autotrophicus]|uniref:ATP-binding protein n=1 Tax=Deferribacter autotrophicus TaxID=500465 RepID=A0A5A8F4R7_9BACT|nr:AAA family ATPase [Deferribacter autotrophicus]KAA0257642.1 ATP-binding protein [Deferribacter autotrophicus]